ncbi:MAG: hypothetical protein JXQ96_24060 [Cyclobacteriaceae bacterium]
MMLKLRRMTTGLLLSTCLILSNNATAQGDLGFDEFLRAGAEDANTILGNYISPFARGFGFGMASGWYNTAKAHKPLGFDLTVTASLAKTPQKDLFFTFIENDYNNLRLLGGGSTELPTIFGGDTNEQLETEFSGVTETFQAPPGIDVEDFGGYVPVPMIQLGLGLVKNTDLKVRYIPTQKSEEDGYEVGLFGIGIMHDFKQWIPGIKTVPLDLSIFVGYTKLTTDFDLSDSDITNNGTSSYNVNALTYQVLASKKLSVLTLYAGLGFNSVTSNMNMLGDYEIPASGGGTIPLKDPIDLSFNSSGPRATLGFRLKLLIISIHADYTIQEYNTITAGIGITVR